MPAAMIGLQSRAVRRRSVGRPFYEIDNFLFSGIFKGKFPADRLQRIFVQWYNETKMAVMFD